MPTVHVKNFLFAKYVVLTGGDQGWQDFVNQAVEDKIKELEKGH